MALQSFHVFSYANGEWRDTGKKVSAGSGPIALGMACQLLGRSPKAGAGVKVSNGKGTVLMFPPEKVRRTPPRDRSTGKFRKRR